MDEQRLRDRIDRYDFRALDPHLHFGTASDRYAGWIGQIYPPELANHTKSRTRRLGGKKYEERTLPVASVEHYFEHFETLEIDFTFYRPLLEGDGEPSQNLHVLREYADHAPEGARFLLKAPEIFFAPTLRRRVEGKVRYVENEDYLDLDAYLHRFHEPAANMLGDRLAGVIFQQAYRRVQDSPPPAGNVEQLERFFGPIETEIPLHIELRSEHLLQPVYFDWLQERGLGHVFSHWTWLPMIREQWRKSGQRLTERHGHVVTRLLTLRDMKYADAYAKAYPFEKAVPELAETKQAHDMILDVTALAFQAMRQEKQLHIIGNNRAYGNSPDLCRAIAHRITDELVRQSESFSGSA